MNQNAPTITIAKGVIELDASGLDAVEKRLAAIGEQMDAINSKGKAMSGGGDSQATGEGGVGKDGEANSLAEAMRSLSLDMAQLRQSVEDLAARMEEANEPQD